MIRFIFHPHTLEPIAHPTRNTSDPVPDLLAKLSDVEETKSGWQCRCPAHDDDKASLSVSRGDDGRALVYCHAGCTAEEICSSLGWTLADLMPAINGHHESTPKQPKRAVATYDYHDEAGGVVMQVVRYEPKTFKQRQPDGRGGWNWSVKGVRVVPFQLDQLAANPGRTVVVVEGEKDVLGLAALGILATCNAGGAGKWTEDHAQYLTGRNVLVIPDNDTPGRKHAQAVAESLVGLAKSVRILSLPNVPEKGDASDWIGAGGTRDDLLTIAAATPTWPAVADPPREPPPAAEAYRPEKPAGRRIEVIHAREFAGRDYHPSWLVRRVLVAGQPAICGGRSKAMKTSNMVDLAVSIGTGTPFLGHFETVRQTVAILSGESGAFTIQETAQRVASVRGVNLEESDVYFGFTLPQISRGPDIIATIDMLNETGSRVLIIDPAYLCLTIGAGGKQTTNVFDMGSLLSQLSLVVERTQATVILCHHCRKSPGEGRDRYDPPDLEELSMAGFAEWARQWMLIGRREAFEAGSGLHKLWLNVGGSVGFSGTWSVDIDEGRLEDDFTGRTWKVTVGSMNDVKAEREERKEKQQVAKQAKLSWEHQQRIVTAMRLQVVPMSRRQIRDATGIGDKYIANVILAMRQKEMIEVTPGEVRGKPCEMFQLTEKAPKPDADEDEMDVDYNPYKDDFSDYK